MKHFTYGNQQRIFLNTALGCSARCQYCYLPHLGLGHAPRSIPAEDALALFYQSDNFIPGSHGTILSLGCYSECWDNENKSETMKLLSNLVTHENYIQMSTKQLISREELKEIDSLALYPGQIVIHLSVPTLLHSAELEPGTAKPKERLSPLQWMSELNNLCFALYIKPVIPNVTLEDAPEYGRLMETYGVPAVVGPLLVAGQGAVLVGEGDLREINNNESKILQDMLAQHGDVYTHSTQIIDNLRMTKSY